MIRGLVLLASAVVLLLLLNSIGIAPFLSFLWTCWLFLWAVVTLAEGAARLLGGEGNSSPGRPGSPSAAEPKVGD